MGSERGFWFVRCSDRFGSFATFCWHCRSSVIPKMAYCWGDGVDGIDGPGQETQGVPMDPQQ